MRARVSVIGATEFCRYPCSNWFPEFLHEEIVTSHPGQAVCAGLYCGSRQSSLYETEMKLDPRYSAIIRKLVHVRIREYMYIFCCDL
jgi:hypothetical protein